jgi:hypothetical protein
MQHKKVRRRNLMDFKLVSFSVLTTFIIFILRSCWRNLKATKRATGYGRKLPYVGS